MCYKVCDMYVMHTVCDVYVISEDRLLVPGFYNNYNSYYIVRPPA